LQNYKVAGLDGLLSVDRCLFLSYHGCRSHWTRCFCIRCYFGLNYPSLLRSSARRHITISSLRLSSIPMYHSFWTI